MAVNRTLHYRSTAYPKAGLMVGLARDFEAQISSRLTNIPRKTPETEEYMSTDSIWGTFKASNGQ